MSLGWVLTTIIYLPMVIMMCFVVVYGIYLIWKTVQYLYHTIRRNLQF